MSPHPSVAGDDLWRRAGAGDRAARDELIRRNLPLVHHVARRFRSTGVEYDELVQVGSIGLMKAVNGFDPARGLRFSTYAVPMITGEILRYLRDQGTVRVSRSARDLARRAAQVRAELAQRLGRQPAYHELAAELGVPLEEMLSALEASRRPISIHETLGQEGDDPLLLLDRLVSDADVADASTRRAWLEALLSRLDPRERRLIILRYFEDLTQEEIAERVGLSQGQVSRLLRRALESLRAWAHQEPPSSTGS